MYLYNITVIVEDMATLGSDLSATMAAYSMGRHLWVSPTRDYAGAFNALNPSREAAVFLPTCLGVAPD